MIVLDCLQGDAAWKQARLGIPTASSFGRIVTPTGRLSGQRDSYLAELLAEWALGEPVNDFDGNEWTDRGKLLEADAFEYYGIRNDCFPTNVGFIYKDESKLVGCSPDAQVNDDGLVEFKCPKASTHVLYLARGECPATYWPQVQGQLWITQREWCDFMSYFPGLPPFIKRVEPDDKYQQALDKHMDTFINEMLAGRERLKELGVTDD